MALLAARRPRLAGTSGPSVEHSAGGDPSRLGREVTGGEERGGSLDPSEFLLGPTELLSKLPVLLLQLVRTLEALADRPLLLGIERERFVLLDERKDLHRVPSVHVSLERGRARSPESTLVCPVVRLRAVRER